MRSDKTTNLVTYLRWIGATCLKTCNIAATKALREADVVVSTSTGASDPRILAACGLPTNEEDLLNEDGRLKEPRMKGSGFGGATEGALSARPMRFNAPDGRPPISFPYVVVDVMWMLIIPVIVMVMTLTAAIDVVAFDFVHFSFP